LCERVKADYGFGFRVNFFRFFLSAPSSLGSREPVAFLYSHFEDRLPDSLVEFKARISTMFPRVFDTKVAFSIAITLLAEAKGSGVRVQGSGFRV
jgi:hypothetical protein